jgi:hypothetical protein
VVDAAGADGVGLLGVELLESEVLDAPDALAVLDDESLEELLLDDVLDDDPRLSVL